MRNVLITIGAIVGICTTASAQVSQRDVSSIQSSVPDVSIVRTTETINGIDIFGTDGKRIERRGQLFRNFSRATVRPNEQAPDHAENFAEADFRKAHAQFDADNIVYQRSVYFRENGALVPATRIQLFDGMFTRTVVVEQDTYRILLDRDETTNANSGPEERTLTAANRMIYPHFDIQAAEFQYFPKNPAPASPHPTGLPDGFQPNYLDDEMIWNRRSFASPMGWLNLDGPFSTSGNNVIATTEGGNSQQYNEGPVFGTGIGNSHVRFSPYYRLDYDWNSFDFLTLPAAAVNGFVHMNLMHDWYYQYGFDEAAGNFQNENFGRGGVGGDPIQFIAYYNRLFVNNAFFSGTEIDGTPAAVIMLRFAWSPEGNDRHSAFDPGVMAHEYQHGVTRRLVGPINVEQSQAFNEGTSDFASFMYTLDPFDDLYGATVAIGDWLTYWYNGRIGYDDNYYYGLRHYPISWDMTKNPTTYINADRTQFVVYDDDGIPRSPLPLYDSPHTFGQVWTSALWDSFVQMADIYGFEGGRKRMMFTLLEGLRLTPGNPTFVEARDSFIAADELMTGGENRVAIWRAFARRGMGTGAISPDPRTIEGVVEDFSEPNWGDFNQDGSVDPSDINAFINAFIMENRQADLNWNGVFDLDDLNTFILLYQG